MEKNKRIVILIILVIIFAVYYIFDMIYGLKKINREQTEEIQYLTSMEDLYEIGIISLEEHGKIITISTIINLDDSVNKLSMDNVLEIGDAIKKEVWPTYELFEEGIYEFKYIDFEEVNYKGNKTYLFSGTINNKQFLSMYCDTVEVLGHKRTMNLFSVNTDENSNEIDIMKKTLLNLDENTNEIDIMEKAFMELDENTKK